MIADASPNISSASFSGEGYSTRIDENNLVRIESWGKWHVPAIIEQSKAAQACAKMLRDKGLPVLFLYDFRRAELTSLVDPEARHKIAQSVSESDFDAAAAFGVPPIILSFGNLMQNLFPKFDQVIVFKTESEAIDYLKRQGKQVKAADHGSAV